MSSSPPDRPPKSVFQRIREGNYPRRPTDQSTSTPTLAPLLSLISTKNGNDEPLKAERPPGKQASIERPLGQGPTEAGNSGDTTRWAIVDKCLKGVARLVVWKDDPDTSSKFYDHTCSSNVNLMDPKSCVTLERFTTPISQFKNPVQMLSAMRDAINGHRNLLSKGILHRQIDIDKILFGEEGAEEGWQGVLMYIDHATPMDQSSLAPSGEDKSASANSKHLFKSHCVLLWELTRQLQYGDAGPDSNLKVIPHDYLDDLDSFFYVFCILIFGYKPSGHPQPLPESLSRWDHPDAHLSFSDKLDFLSSVQEKSCKDQRRVEEDWGPRVKTLFEDFHAFVWNSKLHRTMFRPEDTDSHYDALVEMFRVAIEGIKADQTSGALTTAASFTVAANPAPTGSHEATIVSSSTVVFNPSPEATAALPSTPVSPLPQDTIFTRRRRAIPTRRPLLQKKPAKVADVPETSASSSRQLPSEEQHDGAPSGVAASPAPTASKEVTSAPSSPFQDTIFTRRRRAIPMRRPLPQKKPVNAVNVTVSGPNSSRQRPGEEMQEEALSAVAASPAPAGNEVTSAPSSTAPQETRLSRRRWEIPMRKTLNPDEEPGIAPRSPRKRPAEKAPSGVVASSAPTGEEVTAPSSIVSPVQDTIFSRRRRAIPMRKKPNPEEVPESAPRLSRKRPAEEEHKEAPSAKLRRSLRTCVLNKAKQRK